MNQKKVTSPSTEPSLPGEVKVLMNQTNLKHFEYNELVEKLASIGAPAVPDLLEIVRTGGGNAIFDRGIACKALAKIGDTTAIAPLFHQLSGMNGTTTVQEVAGTLAQLVDHTHANMFIDLLIQTENWSSRAGAAIVLGALVDKVDDALLKGQIVEALLNAFQKEVNSTTAAIDYLVKALGDTKDTRVIDPIIMWMNKAKPSSKQEAIEALGKFNDDRVVDALVLRLKNFECIESCIKSLARIGDRRAVAPIMDVLKNKEYILDHKYAASALGTLGDKCAVDALINCLSTDGFPEVREAAANALGLLNDSRSINALKKAQEDKFEKVRVAATKALGVLGVHESPPVVNEPSRIQGILVLSHGELNNKSSLLWEIAIQQGKLGHNNAEGGVKEVVLVAGDSFNDEQYVYASIRSEFSNLGGHELIDRTYPYDFKSSDGNYGKYYVIFDKPK